MKTDSDERPSSPPIDRIMNCMYDSISTYVESSRQTEIISDNPVRTPDPQENKKAPFKTAKETYPKISSTNKTPTEIIIPKFKLPSRPSELHSNLFVPK